MSNWLTISLAHLNERKVAELIEALRTEALGAGQTDPMPAIIADVTNQIRKAIGFSGLYTLDATATTVPNSLKEIAVKKITREMKGRLLLSLSDDEVRDDKIYESRLADLNKHAWPIDEPDVALTVPETQPASGGVEVARGGCRQATTEKFKGLL